MAGTSLSAPAPSEPVQNVMPLASDSHRVDDEGEIVGVADDARQAQGGRGGSSGWMHMRIPTSSAVGITSRRKRARFSRSVSRVMPL